MPPGQPPCPRDRVKSDVGGFVRRGRSRCGGFWTELLDIPTLRQVTRTIGFPKTVNEKAARTVAAGVAVVATMAIATGWLWLTGVIAYGFLARVAAGPTFSPLGQLAVRVIAPRLGPAREVAGPPKRFAQAIGAVVTVSATVSWAVGGDTLAMLLLGMIVVFATLESVFGICVGCLIFGRLIRAGLVPAATCEACSDITAQLAASTSARK